MDFPQIFSIGLAQQALHFLNFGLLSGNICCSGNTSDIFCPKIALLLQSLNLYIDLQQNCIIGLAQEALHFIGFCLRGGNTLSILALKDLNCSRAMCIE